MKICKSHFKESEMKDIINEFLHSVHCPEDKLGKFFHLQTGVVRLLLKPVQ